MSAIVEEAIERSIFSARPEKTFVDKVLARDDVSDSKGIFRKSDMCREDMMGLLNNLSSNEVKLVNYDPNMRYIMAKFFIWIRDFVAIAEEMYDYEDYLKKKDAEGKIVLSDRMRHMYENCMHLMQHDVKFLADFYFNIMRSSLSLHGSGFTEILRNKFEISYPEGTAGIKTPMSGPATAK